MNISSATFAQTCFSTRLNAVIARIATVGSALTNGFRINQTVPFAKRNLLETKCTGTLRTSYMSLPLSAITNVGKKESSMKTMQNIWKFLALIKWTSAPCSVIETKNVVIGVIWALTTVSKCYAYLHGVWDRSYLEKLWATVAPKLWRNSEKERYKAYGIWNRGSTIKKLTSNASPKHIFTGIIGLCIPIANSVG